MKSVSPKTFLAAILAGALTLSASAETAVSDPSGFVNVDILGSPNGIAYTITPFSVPLLNPANATGQLTAKITGVTATTITNSAAQWTVGQLATAAAPCFVKINTGSAAGRMFKITANTDTTLTVSNDGVDLTTLGIVTGAQGDSYDIIQGQTLLGLFGTTANGVIGGTSTDFANNLTDRVILNDGTVVRTCYYSTATGKWTRAGSGGDQGTLVISPQAGIFYYRKSTTPLAFTFTGRVPVSQSVRQVPASGTTILASYFPVGTTLAALSLDSISGWRKLGDAGVTVSSADKVVVKDGSVVRTYYFDASPGVNFWKRTGSGSSQNNITVGAGSAVYCTRFGTAGVSQAWTCPIPYTL